MNPLDVANTLRARYVSYLTTTFGLNDGYRALHDRFADLLSAPKQLLVGPYLDATAPYQPGQSTLAGLVEEGLLHPRFADLFTKPAAPAVAKPTGFGRRPAVPAAARVRERIAADRVLYRHQETAIRRLCTDPGDYGRDRHTVVASGTGSGKTECFLLPALDWVLRHPTTAGGRGIRVLLVYPMNALVNDQIRRLRQLVGYRAKDGETEIPVRFARYTSETRETRREGLEKDPAAPDNQLLGRDEIIDNPPDILITNFAMLEQAMLRPRETPFFAAVDEFAWRFLILDEAHSYRGAQGIELARLMQRVRAAVRRGKTAARVPVREPVCIATSATLASGGMTPDDRQARTAEFAGSLFGLPFDPAGAIFADRLDPTAGEPCWAFPDAARQVADRAWAAVPVEAFDDLGREPDAEFLAAAAALAPAGVVSEARAKGGDRHAFLYHLLKAYPRFHWLWEQIKAAPVRFEDLIDRAEWAGGRDADRSQALERLIAACNAARRAAGEQSLLPCRYHLFASALEGLFADLATDGEPTDPAWDVPDLAVRRIQPAERKAVELGRCLGCGYPMVVLDEKSTEAGVDQPPIWDRPIQVYAFESANIYGDPLPAEPVDLALTEGGPARLRTLYRVPANHDDTDVKACPNCGRPAQHYTVVSRFLTGQDAPVSILTQGLYEQLPALPEAKRRQVRLDHPHRFRADSDPVVGGGRKLLVFSDSRQNAAFMASYLQDNATDNLVRELAYDAIRPGRPAPVGLGTWALAALDQADGREVKMPFLQERDLAALESGPFANSYATESSNQQRMLTARLLAEVQGTQPLSLEAVGLMAVELNLAGIDGLAGDDPLEVDDIADWPGGPVRRGELREVLGRVTRLMRRQYLVTAPPGVDRPGFSTRQQYLVLERAPEADGQLNGLLNAAKTDTNYVDLLRRWAVRRGDVEPTDEQLRAFAGFLFAGLAQLDALILREEVSGLPALALRHEALLVAPPLALFRCDRCGSLTTTGLCGVCPEPRCRGTVVPLPASDFPAELARTKGKADLSADMYVNGTRTELRCEEHTAQLSAELGQDIQEAFQTGQVNVLSCSTTFEMGIDLGDLQSIVLRNMPPGTAEYVQRAGRAGRRADVVAFVLTFCQRRPHDRHYFQVPDRIIAGEIRPPRIDLDNEKVLQRHCFAEILAEYWQWLDAQRVGGKTGQFEKSGNVGSFFDDHLDGPRLTPADYLRPWLADAGHRAVCVARLRQAFPTIDTDARAAAHLDVLADPDPTGPNPLARAAFEATDLIRSYRDATECHQKTATDLAAEMAAAQRERRSGTEVDDLRNQLNAATDMARSYQRLDRQLRSEFLISYLMSRGVLPSFAFPVNVVKLHVLGREMDSDRVDSRLRLERDGKIGLGDYAPGSRVVAGKFVYESVGLRKFPAQEFEFDNWFRWCPTCNSLRLTRAEKVTGATPECEVCKNELKPGYRLPRQWTQVKWGYVTDRSAKAKPPRGRRPYRTFTTRAFFLGGRPSGAAATVERHPARPADHRIESVADRGRSLLVLNLGEVKKPTGVGGGRAS